MILEYLIKIKNTLNALYLLQKQIKEKPQMKKPLINLMQLYIAIVIQVRVQNHYNYSLIFQVQEQVYSLLIFQEAVYQKANMQLQVTMKVKIWNALQIILKSKNIQIILSCGVVVWEPQLHFYFQQNLIVCDMQKVSSLIVVLLVQIFQHRKQLNKKQECLIYLLILFYHMQAILQKKNAELIYQIWIQLNTFIIYMFHAILYARKKINLLTVNILNSFITDIMDENGLNMYKEIITHVEKKKL
ncbi:hypothetical protein IMG5_118540 [Ichthyophthirius multifiliis]|uniref:Transmembrane protein n=1 Tax=Ichthyophthirius multifiliis TaxID=5932 RepID=G0QUQ3_ICHMU|nr:hypothetical protein IMG5_118540 [Ichthyophthirius multifiliis]EGR31056.1 hypothetical protein IMG5_118540 [Ichthyophthirius multifiliis]|eukprot:XP_004034542.1 hypothetical protein IMG5_118540 [Ichthyophthirius multifiliis]